MTRKPIVWIVKEQIRRGQSGAEAMDYTPAMKWGELRFITDFDPPSYTHRSSIMEGWIKAVDAFVQEFDPALDYIIASGQPTAMMMVAFLLGIKMADDEFDPPRFLLWRREEGGYIPYDPLPSIIKA